MQNRRGGRKAAEHPAVYQQQHGLGALPCAPMQPYMSIRTGPAHAAAAEGPQ